MRTVSITNQTIIVNKVRLKNEKLKYVKGTLLSSVQNKALTPI